MVMAASALPAYSSCHDGTEVVSHMTLQGGNFSTTQAAIDAGTVAETYNVCHGAGKVSDVTRVHDVPSPNGL